MISILPPIFSSDQPRAFVLYHVGIKAKGLIVILEHSILERRILGPLGHVAADIQMIRHGTNK